MKKQENINASRRGFIKTTSLGLAGTSLAGGSVSALLSTEAKAAEMQTVMTAAHWGPLGVVVQDGKVVKSGPAIEPSVVNELQSVVADQVHGETRVKYPMVRKGYLEGNKDTSLRGRDEWVRVSWDKAFELVANEMKRVREAHGPSAIFGGSYGWYSSGALHASRTLLQRYLNLTGGFVGVKGDYSTGAAQVIMPHVLGTIEVYEQQTSWEVVLESSDIIVLWSANPLNTLRIAWTSTDQQGIEYFKKFKESGKRIICIDPVKSESCEFLEAEWVPVNTGTDVALMLGIAHTLVTENKHDKEFLKKYTTGFEKFESYLLGTEDKQPKDAAWASKISGRFLKQTYHAYGWLGYATSTPWRTKPLDVSDPSFNVRSNRLTWWRFWFKLSLFKRWCTNRNGRHLRFNYRKSINGSRGENVVR